MGSTNASHATAASRRTCSRSSVARIRPRRSSPRRTQNSQQCGCTSEARWASQVPTPRHVAAARDARRRRWRNRRQSLATALPFDAGRADSTGAAASGGAAILPLDPSRRKNAAGRARLPRRTLERHRDRTRRRCTRQRRLLPPPRPDRRRAQLPRRSCDPRQPPRHPRPAHNTRVLPQRCQRLHRQVTRRQLPAPATRVRSLTRYSSISGLADHADRDPHRPHRLLPTHRHRTAPAAVVPLAVPAPTTAHPGGDQSPAIAPGG